ncbi:hypothetical protein MKW94_003533 [Papaver nudicaule]|uniref:protein-serine/threonine phosphatase n=1 Tax=Papaver nudicaule TaxID=74823 RepID=A0AA41VA93_PAPNU|nr:hypothetical protein [Papaver nudicaule]
MGCVQGKCCYCCSRYQKSSDGDAQELSNGGGVGNNQRYILTERSREIAPVPSHNFNLEYSVLTQRGYYPDSPDKENQDCFCIKTDIQGNPNLHFFGVFDGHGQNGTECSNFVRDRLRITLHESEIDDTMSGTTAITVLVNGDTLIVANVGDSRAVIAVKSDNRVVAEDLSIDQTPFRNDEYERVKLCGARVLTVDQVEGVTDPSIQNWGDEENDGGDPPRLWVQDGLYPGTAFSRSLGDSTAEKIGVIADPEISMVKLTPNHMFFVIASDGVFEFLSSQAVVNAVIRYTDPRDACAAITGESYRLWLEHENRTDDITIIVVHIKDLSNKLGVGATTNGTFGVNTDPVPILTGKGSADTSVSYHTLRSNLSETQPCLYTTPVERSPACVVPSPTHLGSSNT